VKIINPGIVSQIKSYALIEEAGNPEKNYKYSVWRDHLKRKTEFANILMDCEL